MEGRKMDGCYSWVVCCAVFLIEFIVMGYFTAFGTLFIALINEFQATESSAAWVGSVAFSSCYLSSFLVNLLLPRIGYRAVCCLGSALFAAGLIASAFAKSVIVLFITYGAIFGSGSGFVIFSGVLIIPKFFKFKRGIAYGIALSGHGIGALPMGYLVDFLVTSYGIRTTFLFSAALALPLLCSGLTFGSTQAKEERCFKGEIKLPVKKADVKQKVWKNKALLANCLAFWMYGFGYYVPSVHLVNMAEGLGVPLFKATLLPSVIAISQSVGKIIFGQIAMWSQRINAVYFCQATMFICGLVTTFCPLMNDFNGLLSYTIVYGLFDACSSVFALRVIEDIAGEGNIDAGYSLQMAGMSFFMLVGPPTAGFLYEATGTYEIPFFLSGAFMTTCVCIMFLVPCLKDKNSYEDKVWNIIERKASVLSTSSIDSGISVQRDNDEKDNKRDTWSISSSSSSSSSTSIRINDSSPLSDYETDEENSGIQDVVFRKDDIENVFNEKALLTQESVHLICSRSQFCLSFANGQSSSASRETAV